MPAGGPVGRRAAARRPARRPLARAGGPQAPPLPAVLQMGMARDTGILDRARCQAAYRVAAAGACTLWGAMHANSTPCCVICCPCSQHINAELTRHAKGIHCSAQPHSLLMTSLKAREDGFAPSSRPTTSIAAAAAAGKAASLAPSRARFTAGSTSRACGLHLWGNREPQKVAGGAARRSEQALQLGAVPCYKQYDPLFWRGGMCPAARQAITAAVQQANNPPAPALPNRPALTLGLQPSRPLRCAAATKARTPGQVGRGLRPP